MPQAPQKKCPICGKPMVEAFKPFCSKRCADIDLNRWLTGNYVIPAREDEPIEDDGDENELSFLPSPCGEASGAWPEGP